MSDKAEISDAVSALLRAAAGLSAAQARLDTTPDLTTAERDHAARKVCEAFRRFEAGAKASKVPLTVSIRLTPSVVREREPPSRPRRAISRAARTGTEGRGV